MKRLGIFLILLSGCGSSPGIQFDDEFLGMLTRVYEELSLSRGNFDALRSVRYMEFDGDIVGKCEQTFRAWDMPFNTHYKYRMDLRIWIVRDDEHPWTMASTVLHELGHCVHRMKHSDNPDDIMSPHEGIGKSATPEREKYWEENLQRKLEEMLRGNNANHTR